MSVEQPDFLMFDYETISSNPLSAPVISFGAIIGSWEDIDTNDYAGTIKRLDAQSLYHNIQAKEQVEEYGLIPTKDTLDWWAKQSEYAQKMLRATDKVHVKDHCKLFREYCEKMQLHNRTVTYVRAPQFDHTIADNIHQKVGYPLPYNTWKVRDVRTAVDFSFGTYNGYIPGFREEMAQYNLVEHYAVHDVIIDLIQLKLCREVLSLEGQE